MTKPVIVTRIGKGSELTFQEGDANFTNLRDATISVSGDAGAVQNVDLNGSISLAGGTGLSTVASTDTVTVNLDNTAVTAGSYTNADITVDAQGRVTTAANGAPGYADADARGAISVEQNLTYNSTTGVITGPDLSGLQASLGFTAENTANKNTNNGYAGLDANGKVAAAQLPSYVDDVEEYANQAAFPGTGETGKIYVALDNNKIFRWSGSAYVEISASPGSTDAVTEGTTNLYFTTQRARDSFTPGDNISITNGEIAVTGSLGISSIVEDTAPQLGGGLDVNGNSIVSTSDGNIVLAPQGTGAVVLSGIEYPTLDGTPDQVLTTNGAGVLSFATPSGGGSGINEIILEANIIGQDISNSTRKHVQFPETPFHQVGPSFFTLSTAQFGQPRTAFTMPAGTYIWHQIIDRVNAPGTFSFSQVQLKDEAGAQPVLKFDPFQEIVSPSAAVKVGGTIPFKLILTTTTTMSISYQHSGFPRNPRYFRIEKIA